MNPADAARAAARLAAVVAASKVAHHAVCRALAARRFAAAATLHDAARAVGELGDRFLAGDPDAWDCIASILETLETLEDSNG